MYSPHCSQNFNYLFVSTKLLKINNKIVNLTKVLLFEQLSWFNLVPFLKPINIEFDHNIINFIYNYQTYIWLQKSRKDSFAVMLVYDEANHIAT